MTLYCASSQGMKAAEPRHLEPRQESCRYPHVLPSTWPARSLSGLPARPVVAAADFAFHHENVLGTSLTLHVRADDETAAHRAEARVLEEIDRLAAIFSAYDPASEFSRWQSAGRAVPGLGAALRSLAGKRRLVQRGAAARLIAARACFHDSGRAVRGWGGCPARLRPPGQENCCRRLSGGLVPSRESPSGCRIVPISLDGIAKGYIVEQAC